MLLTGRPTGTAGWGWDDRLLHQRRHNWSSDLLEQNSPWFVWKVGPWNTYVEIKLYIIQYVYVYKYIYIIYMLGYIKPGIFLNDPKYAIVFFTLIVFSGGELPVDKKCDLSSFLWVWRHPWSRVNRCHLLCSFPFITFPFAFISSHVPLMLHFHVALISFHFAVMSFHVPSPCIKDTGLRKLICSSPNARFFIHMSLSFLLSFGYCFGGLCRLPSSGFMNMDMYKLVIVPLLLSFSGFHLKYMPWQCLVWTSHISRVAISRFQMGPVCQSTIFNKAQGKCPSLYARPGIDFHHFHARCWHSKSRPRHRLGHRKMLCWNSLVPCWGTQQGKSARLQQPQNELVCVVFPGSYHWTRLDVSPHNQTTLFGVFILFLSENHSKTLSENSGVFYQKFCSWFKPIPTLRTLLKTTTVVAKQHESRPVFYSNV